MPNRKFCELNVIVSNSKQQNIDIVKRLVSYGYKVIAMNYVLPQANRDTGNESSFEFVKKAKSLNEDIVNELKLLSSNKEEDFHFPDDVVLLLRATFPVSHNEEIYHFRLPYYKHILKNFHLIALEPESEKMLRAITNSRFLVDIIVLPLNNRNAFELPGNIVNAAVELNIKFEISYSLAIKSIAMRKTIFFNAVKFMTKFKNQKGIIITSGGGNLLDFRSPADVINMSNLFEISEKNAPSIITTNCLQAIMHGQIRSKSFSGGVSVERIEKDMPAAEEPLHKKQKLE